MMENDSFMENEINIQSEPASRSTTLPTRIMIKLQKQLQPGEVIEFSLRSIVGSHTEGAFGGVKPGLSFGSDRSGNVQNDQLGHPWMIITNQKLFLVSKGLMSFETRTFRFDQISSVEMQQGILSDKLVIKGMGVSEVWEFRRGLRQWTVKAATYLQEKINRAIHTKTVAANPTPATIVPVSVVIPAPAQPAATVGQSVPMEVLKSRLANGEITPEEYERLKAMIN
jgi:hypothetical protein